MFSHDHCTSALAGRTHARIVAQAIYFSGPGVNNGEWQHFVFHYDSSTGFVTATRQRIGQPADTPDTRTVTVGGNRISAKGQKHISWIEP